MVELRAQDLVPPELTVTRDGALCMDQRHDGACAALDPVTLLCSIYDNRPQTCRDFKRGESLCLQILGRAPKSN